MEGKKYLDEEKYKKASNGLLFVGIGIMLLGVVAIIVAIFPFISGKEKDLNQQLLQLRPALEERYAELETIGVQESTNYKDKDGFEMKQIEIALSPKYEYCEQTSVYVENNVTREYCNIKAQIHDIKYPSMKIGVALIIAMPCFGIGLGLILLAKRRSIMAFQVQQVAPVVKEGVEKATPVVSKAAGSIAKEISKGIKEGQAESPSEEVSEEKPKEE